MERAPSSTLLTKRGTENILESAPLKGNSHILLTGPECSSNQVQALANSGSSFRLTTRPDLAIPFENNPQEFQTHGEKLPLGQPTRQHLDPQALQSATHPSAEMVHMMTSTEQPAKTRRNGDELTNENFQLRAKLKVLQAEREAFRNAIDKMLSDIIRTQSELEEKQNEVARKESEMSILRQKIDKLSTELEAKTPQLSNMKTLFLKREKEATQKKEIEVLSLQHEVDRLSTELRDKATMPQDDTEILSLRHKLGVLAAELGLKETQLKKVEKALLEWESGWKVKLQDTSERLEAEMENKSEILQMEIREYKMRREEAEARLQEFQATQSSFQQQNEKLSSAELVYATALSQVEFERSNAEMHLRQLRELKESNAAMSRLVDDTGEVERDRQKIDELQASHTAELEEGHRMSKFWMSNSEKLSRKKREMMETNRKLQDSLQARDQEIERQVLLIHALRVQLDKLQATAAGEQQNSQKSAQSLSI